MKKHQTSTTDDPLIEMHRKARRRRKYKYIITLSSVVAILLIAVVFGVTVLRRSVARQVEASDGNEVSSAEVTTGSISTTVSGSGTLAEKDLESLTVLSALEIADYYVEEGDAVEEGDLIATVTNASLLTAMAEKQEALDALDEELKEAAEDEISQRVTASVDGRVKMIYVEEKDDIVTAMYEHGALLLLSLDGYMAVEISSESLSAGEEVTVTLSDGKAVGGIVEKRVEG